jgi:hypothetical protein
MNWIALGHLVKAAGYAFFKEGEDEDETDSVPTKSHTQRARAPRKPKASTKQAVSLKKPCCIAKR